MPFEEGQHCVPGGHLRLTVLLGTASPSNPRPEHFVEGDVAERREGRLEKVTSTRVFYYLQNIPRIKFREIPDLDESQKYDTQTSKQLTVHDDTGGRLN